jgi:hypothetical protein
MSHQLGVIIDVYNYTNLHTKSKSNTDDVMAEFLTKTPESIKIGEMIDLFYSNNKINQNRNITRNTIISTFNDIPDITFDFVLIAL